MFQTNAEMQTHVLQAPCYRSPVQTSKVRQSLEETFGNGFRPDLGSSSQDFLRTLDLGLAALPLKGAWAEGCGMGA